MPRKVGGRKPRMKLSPRQREVLRYYYGISNFNKTDAMRRAGYKNPSRQVGPFFSRPAVKAEVARREAMLKERYDVEYDNIIKELAKIAFSNVADFGDVQPDGTILLDFEAVDAHALAAVGEITVETYFEGKGADAQEVKRVRLKPWNKLDALVQLLRHTGQSRERQPLDGVGPLVDRILAGQRRVGHGEKRVYREHAETLEHVEVPDDAA